MAIPKVVLRTAFNFDQDANSREFGLVIPPDTVTQQQFAEECDINTIVARFGLTGKMPEVLHMPVSGDFTGVTDFHSAMNVVRQAQQEFMELPGEMRERFGNDPGKLLAFLNDDKNRAEAERLGLVNKPPEVHRDPVPAAPVVPEVK